MGGNDSWDGQAERDGIKLVAAEAKRDQWKLVAAEGDRGKLVTAILILAYFISLRYFLVFLLTENSTEVGGGRERSGKVSG